PGTRACGGRAGLPAGVPRPRRKPARPPDQAPRGGLRTGPDAVQADGPRRRLRPVEPVDGERATLEARVERFGDGTFVEEGEITYGTAGKVTFTTQGRGWVAPAPTPGAVYGAVVWTVTGGAGRFAGARGLITSNFAVS